MHEIGHVDDPVPEDIYEDSKELPEMEDIPMSTTGVGKINEALRDKIVSGLGETAFDEVYTLLRQRETSGMNGKEVKHALKSIVHGDRKKLKLCFMVDMLIWQEDNYRASPAKPSRSSKK